MEAACYIHSLLFKELSIFGMLNVCLKKYLGGDLLKSL